MISPTVPSVCQDPLVASDGTIRSTDPIHNDGQKKESSGTKADVGAGVDPAVLQHDTKLAYAVEVDPTAPVVEVDEAEAETWSFVYGQLARQLEYYFSEKNLSKDTYLQTLRRLNDGCVPVTILANFAMVKRLIASLTFVIDEEGRLAAVEEAAKNHSERLAVYMIDTKTGLKVSEESGAVSDSLHCIMAVGTLDGKPLVLDTTLPQPSPIVRTIVLRDVETGVTPEEIYELFNFEDFPPVSSIQPDVSNCWFVTLDTEDRAAVLEVLLSLRSMTLHEQPVHARLKSTAITTLVDTAPVMPWVPPVPETAGEPSKRKKKKVRGKKKKNASGKKGKNSTDIAKFTPLPPPTLGEENFPTLQDKKVEWESASVLEKSQENRSSNSSEAEDFDEDEERHGKELEDEKKSMKTASDGASTATTTSSSLESLPKKNLTVGYAAALMGMPDAQSDKQASSTNSPVARAEARSDVSKVPEDRPMSLAPKSDAWGGRRSFAEIVRVSQEGSL